MKGQGTIVQLEKDKPRGKCRKWQLRASVGLDPRTGKYKTRTRRFCGTYTEAKSALRDFIAEIEDNKVVTRSGTTFKECADDFMARRIASGNYTDNTNEAYARYFKAACRHIGFAEVTTIDAKTLESMYAAMRQGDTLSGKPSSGTTLHLLHKTIKLLMDNLVAGGVIVENPRLNVTTPPRDTKERRALKPARIRSFINELDVESEPECVSSRPRRQNRRYDFDSFGVSTPTALPIPLICRASRHAPSSCSRLRTQLTSRDA